jgi:hypothetical protein
MTQKQEGKLQPIGADLQKRSILVDLLEPAGL